MELDRASMLRKKWRGPRSFVAKFLMQGRKNGLERCTWCPNKDDIININEDEDEIGGAPNYE